MSNRSFSKILFLIVLIIIVGAGILAWQYLKAPKPEVKVPETKKQSILLCSNIDYSTESTELGINLTSESERKLREKLHEEGDAALQGISNLTCLEVLNLWGANVSSDVSPLEKLTNLKWLNLSSTGISNISSLKNLIKLRKLYLDHTNVSDVSSLKNLVNLEWLSLDSTKVSSADCKELQQNLPQTEIICP